MDEFVVGIGESDDDTRALVLSLDDPKVRVFDAHWDTTRTQGGAILGEKTNEALDRCRHDWCFYLQADEVVHEDDLPAVETALARHGGDPRVEGLLFDYLHFFGSYDTIINSRRWYRSEVRLVRRSAGVRSHGDAQGFRIDGRRPDVARSGARVFHYGWAKAPALRLRKARLLGWWWHGAEAEGRLGAYRFDGEYGLKRFTGEHPAVMRELVAAQDWPFRRARRLSDWRWRDLKPLASDLVEKLSGRRVGEYRGYRLLETEE